jgi:hypothetical protein
VWLTVKVFLGGTVMMRMTGVNRMGLVKERGKVDFGERVACAKGGCHVGSRLTCKQGIRGRRGVMILGE